MKTSTQKTKAMHSLICMTLTGMAFMNMAQIILNNRVIPVIEEPRLIEIGFGIWEGIRAFGKNAEIHFQPEVFQVFLHDPFSYIPPEGGESIRDVLNRTGSFMDDLLAAPEMQDKTILLSTHGCASRALLNRFYEEPENFWQEGVPPNCAVSIVEAAGGQARLTQKDHVYCKTNTDDMWARQKL